MYHPTIEKLIYVQKPKHISQINSEPLHIRYFLTLRVPMIYFRYTIISNNHSGRLASDIITVQNNISKVNNRQ